MHDLVAPYALDALDIEEVNEFEAHLSTCPQCQADLVELREGATDLAGSVSVSPPHGVKTAVMDAISGPTSEVLLLDSRRPPMWMAVTAVAAALALVFAGLWTWSNSRLEQADLVAAVYEAPDATVVDLETSRGPARFTYSPSLQRGVFNGGQLVEVGDGELYQLWLIEEDGPVSAGTLQPGESDVVVEPVQPGAVLAMTVEAAPGVSAPTGDPLFTADL